MSKPNYFRRNSLRLSGHDYGEPGFYFVTICTQNRQCLFGQVENATVNFSTIGRIVQSCWTSLPDWFANVELDQFIVMPNHFHGIVQLKDSSRPLGTVIKSFKSAATRLCHQNHLPYGQQLWQRGYFDHIIRSEKSLLCLREYISNNPAQWTLDELNPANNAVGTLDAIAPLVR